MLKNSFKKLITIKNHYKKTYLKSKKINKILKMR